MTEQFTPTTEEVRELIAEAREWASSYASWGDNGLVDRLVDVLEAKLTTHDAEVAEKAWDEGANALRIEMVPDSPTARVEGMKVRIMRPANPYRKEVES